MNTKCDPDTIIKVKYFYKFAYLLCCNLEVPNGVIANEEYRRVPLGYTTKECLSELRERMLSFLESSTLGSLWRAMADIEVSPYIFLYDGLKDKMCNTEYSEEYREKKSYQAYNYNIARALASLDKATIKEGKVICDPEFLKECRQVIDAYTIVTEINQRLELIEQKTDIHQDPILIDNGHSPLKAILEELHQGLNELGFFDLPRVQQLSDKRQQELVRLINEQETPYCIALMDHLGFFDYLKTQRKMTGKKINKELGSLFSVSDRTIGANRNVLNPESDENRNRYTSFKHTDKVEQDFMDLLK